MVRLQEVMAEEEDVEIGHAQLETKGVATVVVKSQESNTAQLACGPSNDEETLASVLWRNLSGSVMIYGVADIRRLGRKHDNPDLLKLPIDRDQFLTQFAEHGDNLKEEDGFNLEFYGVALHKMLEKYYGAEAVKGLRKEGSFVPRASMISSLPPVLKEEEWSLVQFADENSQKELVYAIDIDCK